MQGISFFLKFKSYKKLKYNKCNFKRKLTNVYEHNQKNLLKRKIKKIMSANRGEIAVRAFRAAKEDGIKTVAIYSHEDALQTHRLKADESYLIGKPQEPVNAYLDIDSIIKVAKENNVDAIHPGYGFLSERADFAQKCIDNGILYLGPSPKVIQLMGDKMAARKLAIDNNIPIIPGTETPIDSLNQVEEFIAKYNYPIILKAAYGGGGRGMRVVRKDSELKSSFESATSEALKSFGNGSLFIEKYIENPKHIEIQILGDAYGNVVHLFDRDCTIQRRHQKVIEIAPAENLDENIRQKLANMAVKLCQKAGYQSAGTVEFLLDQNMEPYFIEVNSRLQVEHTVTEEITDIDLVRSQIKIAEGYSLEELGIYQKNINFNRVSIQARITTENPENNFTPDYGRIEEFSPPEGPGIRLDGACGFPGAVISPFYDSLLCKVIATGKNHIQARERLIRALNEFKISGIKTNIPFILNVLNHPEFIEGKCTTHFIEKNPQVLMVSKNSSNESDKIHKYLSNVIVNGPITSLATNLKPSKILPTVPEITNFDLSKSSKSSSGWRDILVNQGKKAFIDSILNHQKVLLTDTTLRDAHQSLLATRMRTFDMKRIAPFISADLNKLFSLECWGGATFDVALRFLYECPWDRLTQLRQLIPNIPFQMLLRGANAVGYTNYPDNVVDQFAKLSVDNGMDIFRIFDALNYVPNIAIAMDAVNKAGGVVEGTISYSGDVANPLKTKYTLEYYMNLAKQLVSHGTDILGIKDMAGVMNPNAAKILFSELRKEFPKVPIHFHTHDTSCTGIATYLEAVKSGAHIVDVACDSMSGMTSQPSMGAIVAALKNTKLDTGLNLSDLTKYSAYFEQTRTLYSPFECTVTMKSGNSDVYENEIPGGQYTNLQFQAFSLGLGDQFEKVKKAYVVANELLGDIVKVTPTSKVVGDLAQFMVQNKLSKKDVIEKASKLDFPMSVIQFMRGDLGEPYQGYPEPLRTHILKGKSRIDGRPGEKLKPFDFYKLENELKELYGSEKIRDVDVMSAALYPDVFKKYMESREYGPVTTLPTNVFFTGLEINESTTFTTLDGHKTFIKLLAISDLNPDNTKTVFLNVDGKLKTVNIVDKKKGDVSLFLFF